MRKKTSKKRRQRNPISCFRTMYGAKSGYNVYLTRVPIFISDEDDDIIRHVRHMGARGVQLVLSDFQRVPKISNVNDNENEL